MFYSSKKTLREELSRRTYIHPCLVKVGLLFLVFESLVKLIEAYHWHWDQLLRVRVVKLSLLP